MTFPGYIDKIQKQPPEVFCKKGGLKNVINSQENICARVSFLKKLQAEACDFVKKRLW